MKKVLTHNGKSFNLELKLNYDIERRPGGKVQHLLSTYGIETDNAWNKAYMIDNAHMKAQIEDAENEIKEFADGKKISPEEEIALSLGFKN